MGRQRPHRAHAVAGGVRPPHHAGEVFWPRRCARAGDLLLSRRRLRLERRRLGPLPGAGLPGGKAARPPGAAGATRAQMFTLVGRRAGDGAAAADRRRARRAPRRPPARHRGADLDLRRVRRSGRDADAHDVRLPERRHHAPPGAASTRRSPTRRGRRAKGRAASHWNRRWTSWLRARPRPDRAAPAQRRRPRPACGPALVEQRTFECYRVGAEAFGWARRPPKPGTLRDGRHRLGWGMAAACYPAYRIASQAAVRIGAEAA